MTHLICEGEADVKFIRKMFRICLNGFPEYISALWFSFFCWDYFAVVHWDFGRVNFVVMNNSASCFITLEIHRIPTCFVPCSTVLNIYCAIWVNIISANSVFCSWATHFPGRHFSPLVSLGEWNQVKKEKCSTVQVAITCTQLLLLANWILIPGINYT